MKIRLKWTQVVEYEPDPANYPEDKRTPEGMLEVDLAGANDDPMLMFDCDRTDSKIEGEIVE